LELHIGYVYGNKQKPSHASHYKPKYVPGARLPHAWIKLNNPKSITGLAPQDVSYVEEFSTSEAEDRQYSTLDLCSYDSFTLLVGSSGRWTAKVAALQEKFESSRVQIRLFVAGTDFQFVKGKNESLFLSQGGLAAGGGLLVRPDQHILMTFSDKASAEELEHALRGHLGF
jgi:hypothetical protein